MAAHKVAQIKIDTCAKLAKLLVVSSVVLLLAIETTWKRCKIGSKLVGLLIFRKFNISGNIS